MSYISIIIPAYNEEDKIKDTLENIKDINEINEILVIDDEMHIVELLKFNLEVNGYVVDYSLDGFDGYHKAKEFKPNLILLDWMLPNISGMDVLKKNKKWWRTKRYTCYYAYSQEYGKRQS